MPIARPRPFQAERLAAPGMNPVTRATMIPAATNSSTPIPIWIRRRGQWDTYPAPSQEPATAAPIISTSVDISTLTRAMLMNACANVGIAWPTFSVPGMCASSTTCPSL
jgi:hypothetical protein